MAESGNNTTVFCETQKFCLIFYDKKFCKKTYCPFLHRRRSSIEVVEIKADEGYVLGRCPLIPLCRYFLRGYCTHAGVDWRHLETAESVALKLALKINEQHGNMAAKNTNTNTPSTSATMVIKPDENKMNDINANSNDDSNINDNMSETSLSETGAAALRVDGPGIDSWVNAPEFYPKKIMKMSYAAAVGEQQNAAWGDDRKRQLCPYAAKEGVCKFLPGECVYLHGEICEFCGCAALHPHDEELRKKHEQDCIKQHERNMELSFAIARSKDKTCGICFEVIMDKGNGEQRFGILPNCNHCFCLSCIRKWRRARQFENKIIRACPECRVTSDFVCPSIFWVDKAEDKTKLIDDYKSALSTKDCKYFERGSGKCPFGNKCFYRHAFPDGRICDVGPPPRQRRHDIYVNDIEQVILWDFLDERDTTPFRISSDDLDDLGDFFSDSEESDWSDYEFFID